MTFVDKITEAEAVALAGVSARTLRRFEESGYLEVSLGSDGVRSYVRGQIVEIFGAADALSSRMEQPTDTTQPEAGRSETGAAEASTARETNCTSSPASSSDTSSTELDRLRNLINLQERILDLKDAELVDLRSQRNWLQGRVERLEEKSERDQILLLSETQTIRKLVSLQEGRKSPLQNVLEWLGIAKEPELRQLSGPDAFRNSDTVEVKATAANS